MLMDVVGSAIKDVHIFMNAVLERIFPDLASTESYTCVLVTTSVKRSPANFRNSSELGLRS